MDCPTIPDVKTRDLPITVVRMPPDLRNALTREAHINRSSLNAEIVRRLGESIEKEKPARGVPDFVAMEGSKVTLVGELKPAKPAMTNLTEHERLLLNLFSAMTPEKQLALLTVLKR